MTTTQTAVIVPAAGRGERLGVGIAKALHRIGSASLLELAIRGVAAARGITHIVIAAPADAVESVAATFADDARISVVAGGATRQESVARALAEVPDFCSYVLVHDAARALTPPSLFEDVIAALAGGAEAVVPVLAVADTMKEVHADVVMRTVDRSQLRAVQTPQGFTLAALTAAHAHALTTGANDITDDAGLAEAAGIVVRVIPGHEEAFKVTRPLDLILAEAVLERREGSTA